MLTSAEASLIMCDMQGIAFTKLEERGGIPPTLFIMNSESSINLDYLYNKYPTVIDVVYSGNDLTHLTVITFRYKDEFDDAAILEICREITFRFKPDAMGFISQCLYKPTTVGEDILNVGSKGLRYDPEAIRVIHNCFFIKGEKNKGYVMSTPYILKDSSAEKSLDSFMFEDKKKYTVCSFEKPWDKASDVLKTQIENNYL